MYRISALGAVLIAMTFLVSGCAEMQSAGLVDPLVKLLSSQLGVTTD
jgi:hypothetical protein